MTSRHETLANRHKQITFELDCMVYISEVYKQSPIRSTSHIELAKLYASYDPKRVDDFVTKLIQYIDKVQRGDAMNRIWCYDWDDQDNVPHILVDPLSLSVHGQLWPTDYELVANSPGIQPWSKQP